MLSAPTLLVHVVLVDADTGPVEVLRTLTWPPGFACRVAETVGRMLTTSYSEAVHDASLDALYRAYPSTERPVAERADVTCVGGQAESVAVP
ncbi:hypothetical protein ACLQ28_31510 [Micromonospora sp. DT201]|uniref:hypothetical protein n=1 Tax=Micromonospora sp. DT201 TaxID=3393442 RepID=UPI003CF7B9C7